jgi:hypothetical protein
MYIYRIRLPIWLLLTARRLTQEQNNVLYCSLLTTSFKMICDMTTFDKIYFLPTISPTPSADIKIPMCHAHPWPYVESYISMWNGLGGVVLQLIGAHFLPCPIPSVWPKIKIIPCTVVYSSLASKWYVTWPPLERFYFLLHISHHWGHTKIPQDLSEDSK